MSLLGKFLSLLPELLKSGDNLAAAGRREAVHPEPVDILSLVIEGVEVYAVEGMPTGSVRFLAPGHPWNPTDSNILVCDLVTYVSLAASPDSQRLVSLTVIEGLRALRVKDRSARRRQRRREKQSIHVQQL